MNKNDIILDSINNYHFNFKKLLDMKDTLIWKNCNNLDIIINSKINKIIFEKCDNINLKLGDALIGVEFNNCNDIKFKIKKNKHINCFESFKSTVKCNFNKKEKKKILFLTEKSKIKYIHN